MTSAATGGAFQPDSEVHITFEDQQKINLFAKHNAKFEELKEDLKRKKNELRNLEDAFDELELMDETEEIAVSIDGIFLYQDLKNTQELLEESKEKIMKEIDDIEKKSEELANSMSSLKTILYAKFGSNINLEPVEE